MTAAAESAAAEPFPLRARRAHPVLALARVEGRRLVQHPLILITLALGALQLVPYIVQTRESNVSWAFLMLTFFLACAALLAENFAVLRSRRSGAEELYGAVPLSARARTAAHVVALAWVLGVTTLFLAALTVSVYAFTNKVVDVAESSSLVVLALGLGNGLSLMAGFGALGVMLACWLPRPVVAPLAIVALFFILGSTADASRFTMLAPLAGFTQAVADPAFTLAWHLVYLIGFAVVFASLALLRHGRDRRVIVGGFGGLALVAGSGALQLA